MTDIDIFEIINNLKIQQLKLRKEKHKNLINNLDNLYNGYNNYKIQSNKDKQWNPKQMHIRK